MGSVIDYIACPHCESEAYSDFYYKTGEEYINCNNCGYHYSATIINRDKLLTELTDEDWKINELKNPYGAYRIKYYNSIGTVCGSIFDKNHLDELKMHCEQDNTVEFFTISQFSNGSIIEEVIVDNGPEYDGAGFSVENR